MGTKKSAIMPHQTNYNIKAALCLLLHTFFLIKVFSTRYSYNDYPFSAWLVAMISSWGLFTSYRTLQMSRKVDVEVIPLLLKEEKERNMQIEREWGLRS